MWVAAKGSTGSVSIDDCLYLNGLRPFRPTLIRMLLESALIFWIRVHGELLIQVATGSSNKPRQWRCQRKSFRLMAIASVHTGMAPSSESPRVYRGLIFWEAKIKLTRHFHVSSVTNDSHGIREWVRAWVPVGNHRIDLIDLRTKTWENDDCLRRVGYKSGLPLFLYNLLIR